MQGFEEQALDELRTWWTGQPEKYRREVERSAMKPDTGWDYEPGYSGGCFVRRSDGYRVMARSFLAIVTDKR